jgi:hypothetical protein
MTAGEPRSALARLAAVDADDDDLRLGVLFDHGGPPCDARHRR